MNFRQGTCTVVGALVGGLAGRPIITWLIGDGSTTMRNVGSMAGMILGAFAGSLAAYFFWRRGT